MCGDQRSEDLPKDVLVVSPMAKQPGKLHIDPHLQETTSIETKYKILEREEASADEEEAIVAERAESCDSPRSLAFRPPRQRMRLSCSVPSSRCFRYPGQVTIATSAGDFDSEQAVNNKTPNTSKSHLDSWSEASETIIIFDWDDTLFPTTYVWNDPRLRWDQVAPCLGPDADLSLPAHPDRPEGPSMRDALEQHTNTVSAVLRLATSVSRVAIVTLAQAGWVETSIRNFLPGLESLIKELRIEVIYCRSSVPTRYMRLAREDGQDMCKVLKGRAMARLLKRYYSAPVRGRQGRSWKNVISIGDSPGERLALQDIIFHKRQPDSRGAEKRCRCKVLKMLSEPSLERLTAQMQVVLSWLVQVVHHDSDIDVDFEALLEEGGDDSPHSPLSAQRFFTPNTPEALRAKEEWMEEARPRRGRTGKGAESMERGAEKEENDQACQE
mmetsp:Transcript_110275/g.235517  ORF Transcript_110275/g.235517 Transcript_110275/m.235517 type:complete len:441 (-) Transcript_110275:174-1496(-)